MKEFENNAYFWQKVDALYLSGDFKLLYAKGSRHPKYNNLVFPCDYGHVSTFDTDDDAFMRVFRSTHGRQIKAIVVCANLLDREITTNVLVGLNSEEEGEVLSFLNQNDFQKTVIIHRTSDVPSWASHE